MGKYLRVCIQGKLVEVLVSTLAGGLPKEVGEGSWVAGVGGGVLVIKGIDCTGQGGCQNGKSGKCRCGVVGRKQAWHHGPVQGMVLV